MADRKIGMMTLYCDETDDGEPRALAGWLATPSGWGGFDPAWRTMRRPLTACGFTYQLSVLRCS
jgi:hypothetical protein